MKKIWIFKINILCQIEPILKKKDMQLLQKKAVPFISGVFHVTVSYQSF